MAGVRHILTGWLAGEISPMLTGRVETDQYRYGLATCENWIPTIEGPLVKRGGFEMIRDARSSASWLSPFRRGVTQEYVIEWSELKARFFTNGGRIETAPGVAYEIATPYTALQAPELSLQQNFDRLYVWHASHAPGAIRRDTATTFAHEELELLSGPFAAPNSDTAITVTASGTTGAIVLTASSAIFAEGHEGTPIRLEVKDFGDVKAWEAGMKAVAINDLCHNEGKVYQALTAGVTGQVQPTHSEGAYYDGLNKQDELNVKGPYGVKWQYKHDRFGIATITTFNSATSADATVTRTLPDSLTSVATWRWSLGAFSEEAGWPHLGTLWKGRYVCFKDFDVFGSVVGDYGGGRVNFATHSDVGVLADDLAFRRTLAIEDPPLWVARDRKLMVGTPTREIAIGPINAAAAVSGSNISADDQSFYGSEAVWPVQAGTETLFVERGAGRIRSADFDFARDRYDATDLTASSAHIAGTGIVQLAFQRNPQALVHAVREDGQIAVHPKSRLEIKGFARTVLGGDAVCKSAVSIVGEDGRTEELWILVERLAGDGVTTLKEIWKQSPWRRLGDDQEEQFFVDGGVRIEATAGDNVFAGLTHLASQDVAVLCAGGVVPNLTVSAAGVLTIPVKYVPTDRDFIVIVGLGYSAVAVGLRPEISVNGQSSQGVRQRIRKIVLRVLETVGITVGQLSAEEADGGPLEPLIERSGSDDMDAPIPLKTGDYAGDVDAAFDRDGTPRWISADPVAAIVAAAMLNVEVDTKDA